MSSMNVSGEKLCHITLLCREMICECNTCTTGCTGPTESKLPCDTCKTIRFTQVATEPIRQLSGSFAENCMLPVFYVQTDGNYSVKKCSDIDLMIHKGQKIGFDVNQSNIYATVYTDESRPGYLQLRHVETGRVCVFVVYRSLKMDGPAMDDVFINLRYAHFSQHGPASLISNYFASLNDVDSVGYFSCSTWPPIAKSWIDRKRPSNWPSKETIQTIVSKGCRIVHKPHELSAVVDAEFRFSFSEAELILFGTLTCDQRKNFIAF